MKIGLDLDNTLISLEGLFTEVLKAYSRKYVPPISYDFVNYPRLARLDILNLFKFDDDRIYNLPVYEEVLETLQSWSKEHELYVITARQNKDRTVEFVNKLLGIPKENIFVTGNSSKLPTLLNIGVHLYIDDLPSTLIEVAHNSKIQCVMISREDTVYNHSMRSAIPTVTSLRDLKI